MRPYFVTAIDMIKILLLIYLVSHAFQRRNKYHLRTFLFLFLYLGTGLYATALWQSSKLPYAVYYILIVDLPYLWLLICHKGKLMSYLYHFFTASMLYAGIQYVSQVGIYLLRRTGIMNTNQDMQLLWECMIEFPLIIIICRSLRVVLIRSAENRYRWDIVLPYGMAAMTMLLIAVLQTRAALNEYTMMISNLAATLFTVLIIYLQLVIQTREYYAARQATEEMEKSIIQTRLQEAYASFERLREDLEFTNIRCHDLRHKLRTLNSGAEDGSQIEEIEKSIMLLSGTIKTGNSAFDVIMTSYNMSCINKGICLDLFIDMPVPAYIDRSDIYAIFGNAMDNAINHVEMLDKEDRFISVTIKKHMRFVLVKVENYLSGKIQLVDGLPRTTKEDKRIHGYGMKSIRLAVEKYGGSADVSIQKERFILNILFPLIP